MDVLGFVNMVVVVFIYFSICLSIISLPMAGMLAMHYNFMDNVCRSIFYCMGSMTFVLNNKQ